MSWIRFFRRSRWDAERARELQAYLEIEIDENIARGMVPDEARYAAHRKLGNATLVREEIYQMNTIAFIETIWQDLRYGMRLLGLNPGFALVAILSLALGIGANTAIFQLIDTVRLRALPVPDAHEIALVRIVDMDGARGNFNTWRPAVTNPIWERLRDSQQAFSRVFAWGTATFDLASGGPQHFTEGGLWVSGDFFNALGVRPMAGRVFTPDDDRRGCGSPGAVISYAFWQRELGGDRSVIGRSLSLVLLVAAFLFVGTFRNLITLDAGFRQDGILEADVDLRRVGLPVDRRASFGRDLLDRLGRSPASRARPTPAWCC